MATDFPTSIDSLSNPLGTQTLDSPAHTDQHSDANDAIEAIEAKVGADSSAVTSSHDYKLSSVDDGQKAVSTSGNQTIAGNKTLSGTNTHSGTNTFSKATKSAIVTDTDGATVTFDMDEANIHTVTLGGNRTLAVSNTDVGQTFIVILVQDGTGSRTVTWFSTIKWADDTAPTLTTTAAKADIFGFVCYDSDQYYGITIDQNL